MLVDFHLTLPPQGVDVDAVVRNLKEAGVDAGVFYGYNEPPPINTLKAAARMYDFSVFFGIEVVFSDGKLLWIPPDEEMLKVIPSMEPFIAMGLDVSDKPGLWIGTG